MKKKLHFTMASVLLMAIVACETSPVQTVELPPAIQTEPMQASDTAVPSDTPLPLPTDTSTPLPSPTDTPTETPTLTPTAWAGLPGDMKVMVQKEEEGDFFLYDQYGNELENLVELIDGEMYWYHVSPDSTKIIFTIEKSVGLYEYWLHDLAGGDPTKLFELQGQEPWLIWSPDNQKLFAYLHPTSGTQTFNYYLADLNGGEPILIQNVYYERWEVEWSPMGKYLGFVCEDGNLCLVDAETAALTNTGFKAGGDIQFTKDEEWVLWDDFQYYYQSGVITPMNIFSWKIGDPQMQQVATAKWLNSPTYPLWGKDSQSIYYTDMQGGEPVVMQVDSLGKNGKEIQRFDENMRLISMSPDGTKLGMRNIIILRLGTGRRRTANKYGYLNLADGKVVWVSIKKADKYASTFWAPDSKTFFIVDDKTLLAINTETGEVTTPEWAEWLKGVYGWELLIPGSD